jgi:hypothetical protein
MNNTPDPVPESDAACYKHISQDAFNTDIEHSAVDDFQLMNCIVKSFLWKNVTVTVNDHKTKKPKVILDSVDGIVEAGTTQFAP